MRRTLLHLVLCFAAMALVMPVARAATFDAGTFQQPDGALVLNPGGDYVEPYFATKAILVAQDGGLDVNDVALAWIRWGLAHQRSDGLFRRYCRKAAEWRDCGQADADDSMQALWVQLLYRMAPAGGLPDEWKHSAALADRQLAKLRNGRLGVYHVSRRNHVALLMDNFEVYSALHDIAQVQKRLGDPDASETERRASELDSAIQRIFWDKRHERFRPSMQKGRPAFYPDVVAQVYPWLADTHGPGQDPRAAWENWKQAFGPGWIERRYDPHPWGLVALAAAKLGDAPTAACWTSQSEPLRGSASWNILEEAVWQSLRVRYGQQQRLDPHACGGLLAQR